MTTLSYTARLLSPILPVADMDRSLRFYREVFGFEAVRMSAEYAILRRGDTSLHLTKAADASVLEQARGHLSFYLEVADIQSLWAHVSRFKDEYHTRDLFDREYGMREFHICDPDGCLILVGQALQAS